MSGLRSGVLKLSIGVGTVTMYILHFAISSSLSEKDNPLSEADRCISVAYLSPSKSASRVWSLPFLSSCILSLFISNPITLYFLPNSIARGSPTYPSPMIVIFVVKYAGKRIRCRSSPFCRIYFVRRLLRVLPSIELSCSTTAYETLSIR